MDISTPQLNSPHSRRSSVGYSSPLKLQYLNTRLRQHQQHLPGPDLIPPSISTTPESSIFEEIHTPIIPYPKSNHSDHDYKLKFPIKTLLDWGLTFEEIDTARSWSQDHIEQSKERIHMRRLVECAMSIINPWTRDLKDLHEEYDARMAEWNSTIKKSKQDLEEGRAKKALSELIDAMNMAGYGNDEMSWVSKVLNCRQTTFWAIREWCETRLEKVKGEIEKQEQHVIEMDIETGEVDEARKYTQEGGLEGEKNKEGEERTEEGGGAHAKKKTHTKKNKEGQKMEKGEKMKEPGRIEAENKEEERMEEMEKQVKEKIRTIKPRQNANSQRHMHYITDTQDRSPRTKLQNCRQNINSEDHAPIHDTQESTLKTNCTPEPIQPTDSPNLTQTINDRNHTRDMIGSESISNMGNKKRKRNIKAEEQETYTQHPVHIISVQKRMQTHHNNLDSISTPNTKILRRSSRLKAIVEGNRRGGEG